MILSLYSAALLRFGASLISSNNIGLVYDAWGKPEKALEYYEKALKIFEDLKDERSSAIVKGNINVVKANLKN